MMNSENHSKGGSQAEKKLLKHCETTIARGIKNFLAVGEALHTIRKERLYRLKEYNTFEAYCRKEWGITRQHASRLILTFRLNEDLSPDGSKVLIESEGLARRFRRLSPELQKRVARKIRSGADAREEIKRATPTPEEFVEQIEPALDLTQLAIKQLVDALSKKLGEVEPAKRLDLVKPILHCVGRDAISGWLKNGDEPGRPLADNQNPPGSGPVFNKVLGTTIKVITE